VCDFADADARMVTVPVDAGGMNMDALEVTLRDLAGRGERPRFIYTIPTFQNPTGTTMSLERRRRLLGLAAEYDTIVVEDDAYGDLRYDGAPIPALAALDTEDRVIYVGTFSKILAPGVRMGWACARPEVIARLRAFKIEGSSGPFLTRVVARYCADGRLDAHIVELGKLYRSKRDLMLNAIDREFPRSVTYERPEGGFFVWCRLPEGLSASELLATAEERGATFLPGTHCFADGQGDDAIRLAFSFQPADQIAEAVVRIGAALRDLLE
jgi:2-aminoadipate transaminase